MKSDQKLILVIDDEQRIRDDLRTTLELNKFTVIEADNGKTGFEKIIKFRPDLIIADIMMPVMDGYSLLKEIHNNEKTASIPFLFLTAKGDYDELREGMNLGADDYLTKPFDFKELLNAINARLQRSELNKWSYNSKIENIRNQLFRSIPHEIKTPLNGILNNSEWLMKHLDMKDKEMFRQMLDGIYQDGNRLNRLFENYIFYNKLNLILADNEMIKGFRASKTKLPNYIINDICSYIFHKDKKGYIINVINDCEEININEHHFSKILYELLDNAYKFSDNGSKIKIISKYDEPEYKVKIINKGNKFTKEQIESISALNQFNREKLEQKGIGIGLSIVSSVLSIYGSNLNINSENNITEVSFVLKNS